MEVSIDVFKVGNADAFIVWARRGISNTVVFLDGGHPMHGEMIVEHYKKYIKPHIRRTDKVIVINSHLDKDHVGGLIHVVKTLKKRVDAVFFNDPVDYPDIFDYDHAKSSIRKKGIQKRADILAKLFDELDRFRYAVNQSGILIRPALAKKSLYYKTFRILGPSQAFYKKLLPDFKNVSNFFESVSEYDLLVEELSALEIINEKKEHLKPCEATDGNDDDDSSINQSSTLIEFKVSGGRKFLFTADAGVQAFDSIKRNFGLGHYHWFQLPHHGSRKNINSALIKEISPDVVCISASGNPKHPRRAVIECIKKNVNGCFYILVLTGKNWTRSVLNSGLLFDVKKRVLS
jgi:beta-lactamase superfamily II metal-dependent hydrolase